MTKRHVFGISMFLWCFSFLFLIGGCGESKPQNTLIYGRGEDAKTLDPINTDVGESVKVIVNIFDTLITYHDENLDLVPSLAKSWKHSDDGLTWTFQLREDVKFHDGTQFNADAVVFSFERIIQEDHPHVHDPARPYQPNFLMIEKIVAKSELEVVFKLNKPSAVFLKNLAMFPASIVSPTAVKKLGKTFGDTPVGTGPFRFEKWQRYERLVLTAFDDHWRGRPRIDHVIFVPVSERATRAEKLKRGEIDIADNLAPHEVDSLAKLPGIVVQSTNGINVGYLSMQTEKPPLNNVKVRKAIWHALNKKDLIQVAYSGYARPAVTLVPPTIWGHHDGLKDYAYDPELGRQLLEDAAAEDGFKLPLKLTLSQMADERPYMQQPNRVASFIKDSLKKIGIQVTIQPRKANLHFAHLMSGGHELGLAGWSSDNTDPDNFLYTLLDLDNISDSGNNLSRYRNEELHKVLVEAQTELDKERRKDLYLKAQEIIYNDAPVVPLVHTTVRIALRDRLKGYKLHPSSMVRLRLSYFDDLE